MIKIKKVMAALLTGISILTLSACGEKGESINVYNFGDYINFDVIDQFEDETGIKVNYDTYATNEDIYVKLKQGGNSYDVIFISDYTIERGITEDLFTTINWENVPNKDKVDEKFLDLVFDPGNEYSAPYMWGTFGIIYNTTMVDETVDSWDILWDEKYAGDILMLNSQRDTIGVALLKLGYSMNTRDEKELEEAKNELIKQKPLVYAYLGDDIKGAMTSGEAAFGVVWSGDAMYMMEENPDLAYVVPKEGTNLWFDNMVIPKTVANKDGAEKFIDFMLRPDIAVQNAEYIGYSTPITEAVEQLSEEVQNSPVAYPSDEVLEKTEIFRDPTDLLGIYDKIWTEVTSAK
ncbi:MAG: ABC transporter substrate-binding protein [Clostridium sp.]|nr:ABC transporter substrate-binding protein [Clostridium sp.]